MIEAAVKFGEASCIALLSLNNNCSVTGSQRIREATKELPILPDRFDVLIDVVRAAVPAGEQQLYDAVEELWDGLCQLAEAQGIDWETKTLWV
jgi:hypothetical protein